MKEENKKIYEIFIDNFRKKINYLIADANIGFEYELKPEETEDRLIIYMRHIFPEQIRLIETAFNRDYILSTGILNHRDKIQIIIFRKKS